MLSKAKARKIMENQGLTIGDAVLILVASEDNKGKSKINKHLTKEQVWKIMMGALDELKKQKNGSYNLNDNPLDRIFGQNILREFGDNLK